MKKNKQITKRYNQTFTARNEDKLSQPWAIALALPLFWPRFHKLLPRRLPPPKSHCCLFNNLVKSIKLGNKHFIWIEFFSIKHFYQDVRFKNITQNVEYLLTSHFLQSIFVSWILKQWETEQNEKKQQPIRPNYHQVHSQPALFVTSGIFFNYSRNTSQKVARKTTKTPTKLRLILICNISMCGQNSSLVLMANGKKNLVICQSFVWCCCWCCWWCWCCCCRL